MPKKDSETETFFRSLLPSSKEVTVKPMFGHVAAFVHGNMFAGTFGSQVFVRLSDEEGTVLLHEKGTTRFAPMEGRPMKGYVVIPVSWTNDKPKAREWVLKSFSWVSAMPPKSKNG